MLDPDAAPAGVLEPIIPLRYRVLRRRVDIEADPSSGIDEVVTLELDPLAEAIDAPVPGQFTMVWAPGVGEVPISVSSFEDRTVGLTVRSVGATTAAVCAAEPGGVLGLRGPFGRGWSAVAVDRPVIVVAGGIGLAPLRMHIEALLASRPAGSGNDVVLVVGARTPAEILYRDQLEEWARHAEVHTTVDRGLPGWTGEVGLVTSTIARLGLGAGTAAALCGPEIMMRLAAEDLLGAGADPQRVEVSLERSMACAVAHCGRCQLGPVMLCRDGPVLAWPEANALMEVRRW